jgi:uncharacterized protein DUF5995
VSNDRIGVQRAPDPLQNDIPQPARTVADVISTMHRIDAALGATDGLKWFNLLYLTVTDAIQQEVHSQQWSNPSVLERLDAVFANLYFSALSSWISDPDRTPPAWRPLFRARQDQRPFRVQFALAGMNAHINRDLSVALVQIAESLNGFPTHDSGIHQDFTRVNDILEQAEAKAVSFLATGIVGVVDQALGNIDDILAMWSVRKAREAAWINAEVLWHLRPLPALADRYLSGIDSTTGFASRGLLQPVSNLITRTAVFPAGAAS